MGSQIVINGKSYIGKQINVGNGKIIIDGIDVSLDDKQISITVNGNIETISVDYCDQIQVTGNVTTINSTSGDIDIDGDVSGNVTNKNGNIDCYNIGGSATTKNGNIKHR